MSWQSWLLNLVLRMRRGIMRHPTQLHATRKATSRIDRWMGRAIAGKKGLDQYRCDEINVDRYQPGAVSSRATADRKVLFMLHGGAYCLHSPNIYRRLLLQFCDALDCEGILPDYRLAPEFPHPCGINDCAGVYRQLIRDGYRPENIIVIGDSAGGGLSLSVLQIAIAEHVGTPAAAVLLSPAGDWSLRSASLYLNEDRDPVFRLASFLFFRDQYLNGHNPTDPSVSPLYGSFKGFPPLLVLASSSELLRDTAVEIAEQARLAGAEVELEIARKLCHDYPMFGFLPEARQARQKIIHYCDTIFQQQPVTPACMA